MSNTLIITLAAPLDFEGGKITELTLREPTTAEVTEAEVVAEKQPFFVAAARQRQVFLVSKLTGLHEDALTNLPITAFNDAWSFVENLTEQNGAAVKPKPGEMLDLPIEPPLVVSGVSYSALSLREPAVGHARMAEAAMNGEVGKAAMRRYQRTLVAQVSGVPWSVVGELPVSILNQAAAFCLGFMNGGPVAGAS